MDQSGNKRGHQELTFSSTEEATTLLKWKATFQNKNNFLLASWTLSPTGSKNSSSDEEGSPDACMSCYRVICFNGCVNRLNITIAGVIGTLHEFAFSSLPFLDYVDLSMNQLSGTIPPEIGLIPPEMGTLINANSFFASSNKSFGPILAEIGKMKSLEELSVYENNLSGPIPKIESDLGELKLLHLYSNQLSGPIPNELENLKNLNKLQLSTNQLIGPILPSFGNKLLGGEIPPQLD
ncbi:MDIS1-interacting receptor like kinase 2-like [Lycium barbarum]|uniref:MDIS1-interacting receptor like kinase 2-like n=1 Tax=Lycium barbarum TaxID=112863 RepID=UPI00293E54BF|nr:MDIS1-interacting receptor like kinase 2-like [Lycium barbarum]